MNIRTLVISFATFFTLATAQHAHADIIPVDHNRIFQNVNHAFLIFEDGYCPQYRTTKQCQPDYSTKTQDALAILELGLSSTDEDIRNTTASLVEIVIFEIARSNDPIVPKDDWQLYGLMLMFKMNGQYVISKLQANVPNSPVLAYLNLVN